MPFIISDGQERGQSAAAKGVRTAVAVFAVTDLVFGDQDTHLPRRNAHRDRFVALIAPPDFNDCLTNSMPPTSRRTIDEVNRD